MSLIGTNVANWNVLSKLDISFLMTINAMAICEDVTSAGLHNDYAIFVTHEGDIYSVGCSSHGCLGLGEIIETAIPTQIKGISRVTNICTSGTYGDVLVCTHEGRLFTWGRNVKKTPCLSPSLVEEFNNIPVADVACCRGHYLALTNEGQVYEWRGINTWAVVSKTPSLVALNTLIVGIACGASHSLALSHNGDVYFWGVNWNSDGSRTIVSLPTPVDLHDERIVKIVCGGEHSVVLTENGQVITWGRNGYGQLGNGCTNNSPIPIKLKMFNEKFIDISSNSNVTTAALSEAGTVFMWGRGEADLKFLDPTTTQYKDMHEVFANCSRSSVIWTSKVCGEVSQVVEECPSITKELLPSFNLEKECDLLLIVDSKSIYVHRKVMNERSQFFCSLFNEFWTSKDKREIKLNTYEYEIYLSYIWFLYTGVLKTTVDNLLDLWDLANSYREVSLKQSCEALLKKNLSIEKLALIYSRSVTKKTEECIFWKEKFEQIEDEVTSLRLQLEKEKQIYLGKKEEWEKMQPQKQIPHNQQQEILKTVEQENLPLICEQVPLKQKVKKNNKINSKKLVKKKQILGNNIET